MTATTTCVPLPDLAATVAALGHVSDRLGGATRRLGSLDRSEAGLLVGELESFAEHWDHGVRTLRRSVDALHAGLSQVHDSYLRHERELAARFGGHG